MFLFSGKDALNFSCLSCNTDVPTPFCGHNDNCCHADAPLSNGLYIWVLGRVSYSSLISSSIQHLCHFSVHKNNFIKGLEFGTAKQPHVTPIPLNPMEISVRTVFEQHSTLQVGDHEPSTKTDEGVHNKLEASSFDKDVERGE